jgi:hypothetical protein
MRRLLIASIFAFLIFSVELCLGQTPQDRTAAPSLGDLARQLRAERPKADQKAKVFTNDNLLTRAAEESPTAAAGTGAAASEEKGAKPSGSTAAKEEAKGESKAESSTGAHDEKYYRARMSELQARLEVDRRELSVLQQKLSENDMQYYADPNKGLQERYTRSDINKGQTAIQKKQEEIAADEKAIEDLRDQLRREGGDPGWLR